MEQIEDQFTVRIEEEEVITILTDDPSLMVKLEVRGTDIRIEIHKPPHVTAKILI